MGFTFCSSAVTSAFWRSRAWSGEVRVRVRVGVRVRVRIRVRVRVRLHGEAKLLQAARELGGVVVVLDLLRARARG